MDAPAFILRAAWVAPMSSPVIANGAVAVRGDTVIDVGPWPDVRQSHGGLPVEDLGDAVVLPGLVNAHVHLELSDLTPGDPPASFVDWLLGVMAKAPPPGPEGEARAAAAARTGIAQCLKFGVTTVGDITRFPRSTRQALADSPLRAVSFGEVTAMAARRHLLEPRLAAAMELSPAPGRIISAVSPHAPYSIEPDGYRRCVEAARAAGVPVATHLGETEDEWPFLVDHSGPFRRLWNTIGGWDERVPRLGRFEAYPTGFAASVGLLDAPSAVLAHMNYARAEVDADRLARMNVVYCPRTHAYFGHPPHPWREMLARGVNVAVGTDSTASSPDLNLVDDLRALRRIGPDVAPAVLWEMATVRAARALGTDRDVGSVEVAKCADLVAFPTRGADPLATVLDSGAIPTRVWIGGNLADPRQYDHPF
ncbi:MAG TPA: amidohydrolase family protein [Humisphaera sp.]